MGGNKRTRAPVPATSNLPCSHVVHGAPPRPVPPAFPLPLVQCTHACPAANRSRGVAPSRHLTLPDPDLPPHVAVELQGKMAGALERFAKTEKQVIHSPVSLFLLFTSHAPVQEAKSRLKQRSALVLKRPAEGAASLLFPPMPPSSHLLLFW